MTIFSRYTTIKCPRSGHVIKAPTEIVESIYDAGYNISTSANGKMASVYSYNKKKKRNEYVAPLSYFISDRIAGYKDGNGKNLTKSNLIMMKD